jgi:putative tryptophan/tyrosine transport system substrate-binding protein
MTKLSREDGAGLIVMSETSMAVYRETIISLAARYRLPTIYPFRLFAIGGGLLSYWIDITDLYRGAASYVDRILRGAKPNELPVQLPTKFELIINLKTAKALGLTIPPALIVRADEVIELTSFCCVHEFVHGTSVLQRTAGPYSCSGTSLRSK